MTTVMTIAAGVAVGYLIFQFFSSSSRGVTNGRLHKSSRDKKICGVCGGIAEYLGCDPTIIRLVWAILAFGWGTGVLLYFICAFVLPEE